MYVINMLCAMSEAQLGTNMPSCKPTNARAVVGYIGLREKICLYKGKM